MENLLCLNVTVQPLAQADACARTSLNQKVNFKYIQKTKTEINIFGSQSALCISSDNIDSYIWFGISNDIFNTKRIIYDFDNNISLSQMMEISEIAKSFDINIENGCFLSQGYRFRNLLLLFQFHLGSIYVMVSSSTKSRDAQSPAEDMFGDDILFVHGIWEVELLREFKKKIFGKTI